ncbi:hypothetical protein BpHYR1_001889 [Brachionus plicatilis]|uniref:Uncharacterized protein n=1 Tax=Brachionus plicatilis TaxID=10195 RepID=A0A3M7SJJ8_BRAPC|nr:hypothetical protein BpHYR1_001889 [Brachionus plicatilis]
MSKKERNFPKNCNFYSLKNFFFILQLYRTLPELAPHRFFQSVNFFIILDLTKKILKLMIENNQIPVANIKARKVIASIFGIEYVFIHNICSSSCFGRIADPNLPNCSIFSEYLKRFLLQKIKLVVFSIISMIKNL